MTRGDNGCCAVSRRNSGKLLDQTCDAVAHERRKPCPGAEQARSSPEQAAQPDLLHDADGPWPAIQQPSGQPGEVQNADG